MPDGKLQLFTAPGCGHCSEVKEALDQKRLVVEGVDVKPEQVEIVDVSSTEGYDYVDALDLDRVPAAYYNGEACELLIDREAHKVTVRCSPPSEDVAPAS